MKIYEIGTGYTSIPAQIGAATEIVVEELTRAMISMGEDVQIIDITDKNRKKTDLPIIEVNVPRLLEGTDISLGIMHKLKRVIYSICLMFKLYSILKNEKEKVVLHFHNQYNLFFFLNMTKKSMRDKCFIAYTNHSGVWGLEWGKIFQTIKKRYFQEIECMKKADIVFVLNEKMKSNIIQQLSINEEKIVNISNGVNTEIYYPLSKNEKLKIKEEFGFKSDENIIVQVGSIYSNKGQLKSIKYLLPLLKSKEVIYVFAGGIVSEEYYNEILRLVEEEKIEKQVKYVGMINPGKELNALYNISQGMIFASEYEGFSMVIVEALSAGVPVLVEKETNFSLGEGCIEYSFHDETISLKKSVLNMENYKVISAEARRNVENNYSWKTVARNYINNFK